MAHIISNTLTPGDTVFDIGANLGDKAAWFSDRGMDVVCVEPQPAMYEHLVNRFADTPGVTVVGKGVGSRRGTLQMSISTREPTLSTFSTHWKQGRFADSQWDATAEVEIITLDDLVQEFGIPRYCKIDVEGYEAEVIKGLTRKLGIVSFEFTNEYMNHAFAVIEKLIALGYRKFNLSLSENDSFHFPQWIPYYELVTVLQASRTTEGLWGDIYAN